MDWSTLENFIGQIVPKNIKIFLALCGYESYLSVMRIDQNKILSLEKYVQNDRIILQNILEALDNNDKTTLVYRSQNVFKFLPGHRSILLVLPQFIEKMFSGSSSDTSRDMIAGTSTTSPNNLPDKNVEEFSVILSNLIASANTNMNKSKNAFQYNDIIKNFATYIFLLCGRTCYETLNKNLPIPSTKTILRNINQNQSKIVEGKLRSKELFDYLTERNADLEVWISEDGSGIVSKIQYDPMQDELVGMTLKIDDKTGCPQKFVSTASNEEEIRKFMKYDKSTLVYIVMATPLNVEIPPFILQLFGTNNKFKTTDVVRRWIHIIQELKRYGIKVRGFGTDGDERALGAMCHLMKYASIYEIECNFVQDPTHLGVKLRNRNLRPTGVLPMGTKQVSAAHLKILLRDVPKNVHGLTRFDISPDDRQNFNSLKRCMTLRVRNALTQFVPGSEGTSFYLLLCEEITSSFMSKDMIPLERIDKLFHAIYFLRILRRWILSSGYNLKSHFISRNAYVCAEINGANLLSLMKRFHSEPEKLQLSLFDSQACESEFRQFRSMGSMNFTRINFTLLELLYMIRRIECQSDILYNKLAGLDIELPKLKPKAASERNQIYPLPSDEEIQDCLDRAKRHAISDAAKFGMHVDPRAIETWELPNTNVIIDDVDDDDEFSHDEFSDEEDNIYSDLEDGSCADIVPDDAEMGEACETKKYVTVLENGEEKSIAKGTLVWLLSESREKLSKDRTRRVQECGKGPQSQLLSLANTIDQKVVKSININLCEWCVFKDNVEPGICFGLLLAFRYALGKRERDKRYKFDTVDLGEKPYLAEQIEALSSWYYMNDLGRLVPTKVENHYFLSLKNYIATVMSPTVDPDTDGLYYNESDFREIDSAILSLI